MSRFAIIPARAFDDARMDSHLRDVLALLSTYADREGWCWPGQETLGNRLGLSRTTVNGYIRRLQQLGYLEARRRQAGCLYRLLYDLDVGGADTRCRPDQHQMSAGPTQNSPNEQIGDPDEDARARGMRLPEDWGPDQDLITWATRKFPAVDLARETERFRRYWSGKTGAGAIKRGLKGWSLAWQNWIDKAEKEYVNVRPFPYDRSGRQRGRETAEERRAKLAAAARSVHGGPAADGAEG